MNANLKNSEFLLDKDKMKRKTKERIWIHSYKYTWQTAAYE